MNPPGRQTERCERLFHVRHETSRPAEVDIRLMRDADVLEGRLRQTARSIEILAQLVAGIRSAVADEAAALGEGKHQAAYFMRERMMPPVARRMQPENLSCRAGRCQGVQHGQNGRCPDPRAKQHHRPLPGFQGKSSSRRTHLDNIACVDVLVQVISGRSIRLDLDADPIALCRSRTRD